MDKWGDVIGKRLTVTKRSKDGTEKVADLLLCKVVCSRDNPQWKKRFGEPAYVSFLGEDPAGCVDSETYEEKDAERLLKGEEVVFEDNDCAYITKLYGKKSNVE